MRGNKFKMFFKSTIPISNIFVINNINICTRLLIQKTWYPNFSNVDPSLIHSIFKIKACCLQLMSNISQHNVIMRYKTYKRKLSLLSLEINIAKTFFYSHGYSVKLHFNTVAEYIFKICLSLFQNKIITYCCQCYIFELE